MSRLVNPGPGEITDRLTILALKLLFGAEAGKDCTLWSTERATLLGMIRTRTGNGKWFEAVLELAAVNAALWHAEDDLRDLRGEVDGLESSAAPVGYLQAGRLAFRIQSLNDQRAALVERINRDAGEGGPSDKLVRDNPKEDA